MTARARNPIDFSTFPTSDGEPIAETTTHREQLIDLIFCLTNHLSRYDRVCVSGNMLMYYNPRSGWDHVSADVFVTFDVEPGDREKWETWNEGGRFADVVFEITSPSTIKEDLSEKRPLYAQLGVQELYLYDPRQQLRAFFRGYRLIGGDLIELPPPVDGAYYSDALGANLQVTGQWLRVINPATGEPWRVPDELEEARRIAEQQYQRAATARRVAREREQQAEEQHQREMATRRITEERHMGRSYLERNAVERERLRALIEKLSDEDLAQPVGSEWTVAVVLAHLAFWDRFVLVRWQRAARDGQRVPAGIADTLPDLINDAALQQWRALPPRLAAQQAIDAAEAVEQHVAALPDDAAAEAIATGRMALLDRTLHWRDHLEEIEHALGHLRRETL